MEQGWFTYDHRPRYGTNYYGLRGRIGILSEAYSHDPFRTRIASTYAFTETLLSLIGQNSHEFLDRGRDADRQTTAFAVDGGSSPRIPIRSRIARQGHVEDMLVEILERTGDSVRTEPGLRPGIRRTGRVRTARVPVLDRFEPVLDQSLPYAWVIPAGQEALLAPLRAHGVFIERTTAAATARVERFRIDSVASVGGNFGGPRETRLSGNWMPADTITVAAGSYVVRARQPLGILALYLLEPMSDDGLVTWHFLDSALAPGGVYPIPRVVERFDTPLQPAR